MKKYDAEMIKDFLAHLVWEVRISHAEHSHLKATLDGPPPINQELVEALREYTDKYDTFGLLPVLYLEDDVHDRAMLETAVSMFHEAQRQRTEDWLKALEALRSLFKIATDIAGLRRSKLNGKTPTMSFKASQFLR